MPNTDPADILKQDDKPVQDLPADGFDGPEDKLDNVVKWLIKDVPIRMHEMLTKPDNKMPGSLLSWGCRCSRGEMCGLHSADELRRRTVYLKVIREEGWYNSETAIRTWLHCWLSGICRLVAVPTSFSLTHASRATIVSNSPTVQHPDALLHGFRFDGTFVIHHLLQIISFLDQHLPPGVVCRLKFEAPSNWLFLETDKGAAPGVRPTFIPSWIPEEDM
eukprot:GHVT01096074.1.p1 GENE.GHVT01096074.1~~GHVT01096074.1.p1  ORF type:complete len:219 (+),score=19.80 GHVT01096074.1:545-1201(+)